jgi:hypothetical protein
MGRGRLLLLSAWLGLAAAARADEPPRLLLPPAPVSTPSAIRPVSHSDDIDLPPGGTDDTHRMLPEPKPRPRSAGLAPPDGVRPVQATQVDPPADRRTSDRDLLGDFFDRRTGLGSTKRKTDDPRDRSAGKLGGLFDKDDHHSSWFCSDHGFDQFASPVTNPFLFEDPRALTEVRPIFLYQKVPSSQPNFQGGNLWFFGMTGSVAFTERFSLTINKFGGIGVDPAGSSTLDSRFGFAELWLGPKVTIYRDPDACSILSGGLIFQIPIGSGDVRQDTGSLSLVPYLSGGQTLWKTRYGSLNGLATIGYAVSVNKERSDYFYASGHIDYDVGDFHRFYPLMELNWFQVTTNGTTSPIDAEGRDLINFGGAAKGSNLMTWAIGGRLKLTESAQVGAAFELPVFGNRDLFQYRFTLDFILRY